MPFVNANAFAAELNKQFAAAYPDKGTRPVFFVKSGPKYDKVIYKDASSVEGDALLDAVDSHYSGSVFCFINAAGDVFKAASYKSPAKGVRANLYSLDEKFIAERIVAHGFASTAWLYR